MSQRVPPPLMKREAYEGIRVWDRVTGQAGRIAAISWPRLTVFWGTDLVPHLASRWDVTTTEPRHA